MRSNDNFTPIPTRTKRFKQSFFPSTVADWNRLDTELRNATPLSSFKNRLRNTYCRSGYNKLFNISLNRQSSILHTRLRLGHCQLNFYLYKIDCKPFPFCDYCWGTTETITHYFLYCTQYAVQRDLLSASTARLFNDAWFRFSDKQKVQIFLHGSDLLSYDENVILLRNVQLFILNSNRFS